MKRRTVLLLGLVAVVVLSGALGSCDRRSEAEAPTVSPPAASPPAVSEQGAAETPATPDPKPQPEAEPEPEPEAPPPAPVVQMEVTDAGRRRAEAVASEPLDPRETAFEAQRFAARQVYPYDFTIGRLQARSAFAADEAAAFTAAATQLRGIVAGAEVTQSESTPARENAVRLLQSFAESSSVRVRVGSPRPMGSGEVSVLFRVVGPDRSVAGEMILETRDGEWYSSGIQVQDAQRRSAEQFDPTAFRPASSLR